MTNLFDKLNLNVQERRLVVITGIVVFALLNWFFVFPEFGEYSKYEQRIKDASAKLKSYQDEIARRAGYDKELKELKSQGGVVPTEEAGLRISQEVNSQAALSGVTITSITPLSRQASSGKTNAFFEEAAVTVNFQHRREGADRLSLSSGRQGTAHPRQEHAARHRSEPATPPGPDHPGEKLSAPPAAQVCRQRRDRQARAHRGQNPFHAGHHTQSRSIGAEKRTHRDSRAQSRNARRRSHGTACVRWHQPPPADARSGEAWSLMNQWRTFIGVRPSSGAEALANRPAPVIPLVSMKRRSLRPGTGALRGMANLYRTLAGLAIASLLAGAVGLHAADGEASVKLTGIAHFNDRSRALLEIQPRPGRPVIKPILGEGERIEGVEVKQIDLQSGRVQVIVNGVETFYMIGTGEGTGTGRTLRFKSADLSQVLEIYQELSGRTVLRQPNMPGAKLDLQTGRLSNAEALQALDQLLLAQRIASQPAGDKFLFVVRADQTNRLSLIPSPPPALGPITQALRRHVLPHIPSSFPVAPASQMFPSGLIKFQDADVLQVLEICQELRGATLLCASDLPYPKISLRSQTEMTRDEAIWMLDAVLALGDIAIIPHGAKFFFALPGMGKSKVPVIESLPLAPAVSAGEVFPAGLIKFQGADLHKSCPFTPACWDASRRPWNGRLPP